MARTSNAARRRGPDFSYETAARARLGPEAVICGVDEAGRGPLAGPVVAAAVAFRGPPSIEGLDDSKALTPKRRDALYAALMAAARDGAIDIGVAAGSVRRIEALNILRANDWAMRRAVARLARRPDLALIDGARVPPDFGRPAEAIVKGDAKSLSIAAASILAKVTRDRIMQRLAARHSAYGWDRNAGYPTAEHRAAIAAHGPTRHHRMGFSGVAGRIGGDG